MRKRLALIFCMLVMTICGLVVGCGKDPYANIQINIVKADVAGEDGISTSFVNRLYIAQTQLIEGGKPIYNYDDALIDFKVKVSGVDYDDVDPRVVVSGWEGYIVEPVVKYLEDGISHIVSRPLSETSTGKFTLKIQTLEGNQSLDIDFQIDLRLNDFYFNESNLQAVSSDYEICLDDIGGLIDYYPASTTQKKIEYSIAIPTDNGNDGNYMIEEAGNLHDVSYYVDSMFSDYMELGYKYAEIVEKRGTGKQVLKVYPYLVDSLGKIVDEGSGPIPSPFPRIKIETTGAMQDVYLEYITIKAHSVVGDKYLDVEVVPSAGDVLLSMNSQISEEFVTINKDNNGNYNVVLIDPDYKGGILSPDEMSYYSERDLSFVVTNPLAGVSENTYLDDYEIIANNVMPDDNLPVDISMIGERDNFKVSALTSGTYTHTFNLEHKRFRGVFTQEIKVNFKVLSIPFAINVNNNTISSAEPNEIVTTIYNYYPRGSYGTRFNVDTKSGFNYFVFYTPSQADALSEGLTLRRDGDGAKAIFALGDIDDIGGVINVESSMGKDTKFTSFAPSSNFFLTHNLDPLPKEVTTIYIGIIFSMADSSYGEEIVKDYFAQTILKYPIHLTFENGLREIKFVNSEYKINLDNEKYLYKENGDGEPLDAETGHKLFSLPAGRVYNNTIKRLTYDENLIKVYSVHDEQEDITTLYVKYVDNAPIGETDLVVESYNGIVESVSLSTYVSTIYKNNGEVLEGESPRMPLAIELDKYSTGYLYYISSGADEDMNDHEKKYTIYSSIEDTVGIEDEYNSVDSLFMIVNAEQRLRFYDFRIGRDDEGYEKALPIDITSQVRVVFDYPQYASYNNGVIKTNNLPTSDINSPIIMTITYVGAYEVIEDEVSVYKELVVTHIVKLFIYVPLEGVEVTSSKTVDLYIENSLGYYNEDLSKHTIISTYKPNEINLGAQWNDSQWFGDWDPVELRYEYKEKLESPILNKYGREITVDSLSVANKKVIYYKDLFNVTVDPEDFECHVQNIISDEFDQWLNDNGYVTIQLIEGMLDQIFKENIEFYVNIYINQFNKLQNINSVRFIAKYADRIGKLKLDVEDDGVYFEIRKNVNTNSTIEIAYTIDNADVINKDIVLQKYDTVLYQAEVVPNLTGNGGKIIITAKSSAGTGEITLTTADNVESLGEDGEFIPYRQDSNLVKSFRVKIADGTEKNPFEIKSVQDYQAMISDINAERYFYYVISRDINIGGYNVYNVNLTKNNGSVFSLSGKHTYIKNEELITVYNSIYNLTISQTIEGSDNVNVGLFGEIGGFVKLDNISIVNAYINVIDESVDDNNINVGLLAGTINGAQITSCSVDGDIRVVRGTSDMKSTISVGGMAGFVNEASGISKLPGKYEDGIVATGNTSNVDIELALAKDVSADNSLADKNNVGGLVGFAKDKDKNSILIDDIQVVCNLTSVIRTNMGGVIGSAMGSVALISAYVVPTIVVSIDTADRADVKSANIGGVIGSVKGAGFKLEDTVVNFLDIGDGNYTWQHRTSIFVSSSNGTEVSVGGMIGILYGISNDSQYNYVRSYYERDIDENYKGNIYVVASTGSVGGLVGNMSSWKRLPNYSYFDGDISASEDLNKGMLIGVIKDNVEDKIQVHYSYAIGHLNEIVCKQIDDDFVYELVPVNTIKSNAGMFGNGLEFVEQAGDYTYYTATGSFNFEDSYVVINGHINYIAVGGIDNPIVYAMTCQDESGKKIALTSYTNKATVFDYFSETFECGDRITLGEDSNLSYFIWFWNENVNTVKVGEQTVAYPVLLKDNMVMFDLVPNEVSAKINERDGLYDITYNERQQVIMYINRLVDGGLADNTYYDIAVNKEKSSFEISLSGTVVSTTYINLNNLKMNDKIEILESSDGSIINIVNNRIYPVATGVATLTIRSFVAKSVKAVIDIVVVDGMTEIDLVANNKVVNEITHLDNIVDYLMNTDNPRNIYIDELTSFYLQSMNIDKDDYLANNNYGFILEILNAEQTITVGESEFSYSNAVININDQEYTFNPTDASKNIIVFNGRDFKVAGVGLGVIKFIITPFITLDNAISYEDTYIPRGVDEATPIKLTNVYLLDSETSEYANLQKEFAFNVKARAISIENTKTEISLDSSNRVSFNTILETANVKVDETNSIIEILENIEININNRYTAVLNLEGVQFTYIEQGNQKIITGTNFQLSQLNYFFDYDLINITFSGMTIVKTNINSIARYNTYKISFVGLVNFDREFYRANAEMYDLNSAKFDIVMIPTSNGLIKATTIVTVVPKTITSIFTNFYTKMETVNPGEYNEYPSENESVFIVPGRSGLLKITLGEEFNNSSYVTLVLDKKYFGYVELQQLAAEIGHLPADGDEIVTEDILGYKPVISLETLDLGDKFGIKLSKLSLNYNDINYFNNTYYIKLLLDKTITENSLDMEITSYMIDNNVVNKQLSNNFSLTIMDLPDIKVTLDNKQYSILGKGVKKELDISFEGLTEDIIYTIRETTNNSNCDINNIYITDDEGQEVLALSLDYISSGRKYYINQDVTMPTGCSFEIEFSVTEVILGVLEKSECSLYFDTVDIEIEEVKLFGVTDTLYIKFGENMMVETAITIKDIVVGRKEDIEHYKVQLDEIIKLAQYELAGITYVKHYNGKEDVLSSGKKLNLQHRIMVGNIVEYEDVSVGNYGGITIKQKNLTVQDKENDGINYLYRYFELTGTEISNDTYIRLDVSYYYQNGKLAVGDDSFNVYGTPVDLLVVVEDNSTYDHPIPVENAEKLMSICGVEGGNFILVNNIVLDKWIPQEAKFNTFDGNGYTITINSFDLSSIRGKDAEANVGIFSIISESTLLKNLIVDISPLLKSDTKMLNDVAIMRASSKGTYTYNNDIIDLGYTRNLNFGVIAGINNGAITNARVISTKITTVENSGASEVGKYLHVLTTQGYDEGSLIVSNIGGIVGVNAETGAITNSFIGVNASDARNGNHYYIKTVTNPSAIQLDNEGDQLNDVEVYPFVLAGGNNIGGLTCINNGIISNCYAKGLGVFNTYPTVGDSATAGLVTFNNNIMTSTFVEGDTIENYRANDNTFRLESTGYIGGLVYENSAIIENSYSNAFVQTLSSFMGGFVFVNNSGASISNSYSTAVNRQSLATGQFTGVKQGVVQNFGTFTNCYYLVDSNNGEFANANEDAVAICGDDNNSFDNIGLWGGFSFVAGKNVDGIWDIEKGKTPRIATTLIDTISFRILQPADQIDTTNGIIYNYIYEAPYYLGTKENPLIVDKAENFDKYIIDSSYPIDGDENEKREVFGYRESEYASRYVRVVNNLDFEKITTAQEHKGTYLYKVVFAGVLDGNGMTFSNLNINTDSTELENFGLFAQIGYENASKSQISADNQKAVIKNANFNVRTFKSAGNSKVGILAGTIVNSSIVNVKINGGNQTVGGLNMAGALAGLIYTNDELDVTLIDVTIENVRVEATHGSLGGTLSARSEDKSNYFFNSFSIERNGQQSTMGYSFKSLYNELDKTTNLSQTSQVSYVGGVAGVILANNYKKELFESTDITDITKYRTKAQESTISNIIVKGGLVLSTADNAGGLFGYVGENTLIRNSRLIVSDGQLLKAFNNIGGIVGENHGIIEQCTVAYNEEKQAEYDATIISDGRINGTFNLFDMAEGEPYYVVSIGGIAGYSQDGVIIDSYSKVNVTKALSYIAGGVVGYAKGDNYIGYVYNTGAVYAKYIIGGIVGLQVNDFKDNDTSNKLYMNKVVSLTNWNANSETIYFRNEITKLLYEDQKLIYAKDDTQGYNNFYIKMPEVGNASISCSNADMSDNYRIAHSSYYVGSVIGKAIIKNDTNIENGSSSSDKDNYHVFANNELLNKLYGVNEDASKENTCAGEVFSSTLGIVSTEGSVESGTRNDDYFKTGFSIELGDEETINSLSYRIAYPTRLNNYESVLTTDNGNDYLDKAQFSRIFSSQEYIQQLLGVSYKFTESEDVEAEMFTSSTYNIFQFGTEWNISSDDDEIAGYDRYAIKPSTIGKFFDSNANIWDIEDSYLPFYSNGVASAIEVVDTNEELIKAFKNSSTARTYEIISDITVESPQVENRFIQYYGGVKSLFIGKKPDGTNAKIIINMDGNSLATVFNIFSGAVLQNLDFEIVVNKNDAQNSILQIDTYNYGIFANTLDGVQINNCNFDILVDGGIVEFGKAYDDIFYARNVGVLFGSVNNSSINNSTFNIRVKNGENGEININNEYIANFGLFAGSVSMSSFKDCTFAINNVTVNILETADKLSVGGLIGTSHGSRFSNFGILNTDSDIVINDRTKNTIIQNGEDVVIEKSIGSIFGTATQITMSNLLFDTIEDPDTHEVSNTLYTTIPTLTYNSVINDTELTSIGKINIALFAGKSEASRINNVVLSNSTSLTINENDKAIADELNIGSLIGNEIKSSQLGKSGVVGSYSPITSSLQSYALSVGGIVGRVSGNSQQLLTNTFSDNAIIVTNNNKKQIVTISEDKDGNEIEIYTHATSHVGGIVGYADGSIGLDNVVSLSNINLNIAEDAEDNKLRASLGGIIGGANSTITLNNFASLSTLTLNKMDYAVDTENGYYETYMGGVVGNNAGMFSGTNGYSYVQLPRDSATNPTHTTIKSAITNGVVSTSEQVYYTQEFLGNNYSSDIKHVGYAMADLYDTISEYSTIYDLTKADGMAVKKLNELSLIIPTPLVDYMMITREEDKFKPNIIDDSASIDLEQFNVILTDIDNVTLVSNGTNNNIGDNIIVSGRSTEKGKVVVTRKSDSTTGYFVATNSGVISNIYLCTGIENNVNNLALVNVNNGLITNVYVYGLSYCNYAIANTNNGEIYSAVSSIKYLPQNADNLNDEKLNLYGLVKNNNATGVISDCYSSSFGYTASDFFKTNVYGFAEWNYGTIAYSAYYIPEDMIYDNIGSGYHKTPMSDQAEQFKNAKIISCYNSKLPTALLRRDTIWTEENDHIQAGNMKDPEGSVVIRIFIKTTMFNTSTEIISDIDDSVNMQKIFGSGNPCYTGIAGLKAILSTNKGYELSYEYDFYVSEQYIPSYNVVRISTASAFHEYIDSLTNGYIPANTIVLLTNDITQKSNDSKGDTTHIFNLNAGLLNTISISANSAIIGINTTKAVDSIKPNIILKFGGEKNKGVMAHELIDVNKGIISGITIEGLEVKKTTSTPNFAPIMKNEGVISNVQFNYVDVRGMGSSYVSGMVDNNTSTGHIIGCSITNCYIYSLTWVNRVCYNNKGNINAITTENISYVGNLSFNGV